MATEVFMPKMSDHMEAGEVVRWLVAEGDRVEVRQPIMELMTDKVAAELEAPASGVIKGIRRGVEPGAIVPVGETIAFIAAHDEAVPELPPLQGQTVEAAAPQVAAARAEPVEVATPPAVPGKVRATPAARALARQLGVDIALVTGTGPLGRVREEDVRAYAASGAAQEAFAWQALNPIQRVTGERLTESVRAPQFALEISVDATALLAARDAAGTAGARPSVTALLVKRVAAALRNHPRLNSSFEAGRLKVHRRINVGVAVGAEDGLVVPVVKEADRKPLDQVAAELRAFTEKARARRLEAADLSGGTFTISNLGMYGIDRFAAIINPPEAAILAIGRTVKTLVVQDDDTFAVRPMMTLTLTVDHRVVDGVQAAAFLAELKDRIEGRITD